MDKKEQIKIAENLQKYELGLSHLYNGFAKAFPEHKEFWTKLSVEEDTHAFMLRSFKEMVENGDLELPPRRFSLEAIDNNLRKLSSLQDLFLRSGISLKEALEWALEIESGILEHQTFLSVEGDPPEMKRVLDVISADTRRHSQELKNLYKGLYK